MVTREIHKRNRICEISRPGLKTIENPVVFQWFRSSPENRKPNRICEMAPNEIRKPNRICEMRTIGVKNIEKPVVFQWTRRLIETPWPTAYAKWAERGFASSIAYAK